MVFSSLIFIFGFLPPTLILAFLSKKFVTLQNIILLLASLIFYSYGEPKYIKLFICIIIVNWLFALLSGFFKNKIVVRTLGSFAIILDLCVLFWFKYAAWIGRAFNSSIGSSVLPIGISFYIFQAISYMADTALLDKYKAEKNPINVGLYIAFFPQLIAGPIVRFDEMREQIRNRQMTIDGFEEGSFRFILGFCKKVLLADSMAVIVEKAFSGNVTSSFAWLGAIAYTFQILMDFSGYSDMAIGLGSMFGFKIPENFNNPYKASSIRDFWRRWHITLSVWLRDYVYIPLGGNRKGKLKMIFNISVVWLFTGIWHGANITFVVWGVVYGAFVLFEKLLDIDTLLNKCGRLGRIFYRLFSLLVIVFLWVVFRSNNISVAYNYICVMLHFSSDGLSHTFLYFSEFIWAIFACLIMSVVSTDTMLKKRNFLWPFMILFFIVSVSYLVKRAYSPFLYFNF